MSNSIRVIIFARILRSLGASLIFMETLWSCIWWDTLWQLLAHFWACGAFVYCSFRLILRNRVKTGFKTWIILLVFHLLLWTTQPPFLLPSLKKLFDSTNYLLCFPFSRGCGFYRHINYSYNLIPCKYGVKRNRHWS